MKRDEFLSAELLDVYAEYRMPNDIQTALMVQDMQRMAREIRSLRIHAERMRESLEWALPLNEELCPAPIARSVLKFYDDWKANK